MLDFEKWARRDYWFLEEFAMLLLGLEELSRFDLPRDRPGRSRGEPPAGSNGKC